MCSVVQAPVRRTEATISRSTPNLVASPSSGIPTTWARQTTCGTPTSRRASRSLFNLGGQPRYEIHSSGAAVVLICRATMRHADSSLPLSLGTYSTSAAILMSESRPPPPPRSQFVDRGTKVRLRPISLGSQRSTALHSWCAAEVSTGVPSAKWAPKSSRSPVGILFNLGVQESHGTRVLLGAGGSTCRAARPSLGSIAPVLPGTYSTSAANKGGVIQWPTAAEVPICRAAIALAASSYAPPPGT
jgi:hypothetical protein